jgi:predicted phosphodiesterase
VLRFLHISDIHFATTFDDSPELDVEAEVRERMLVDFSHMRERCGPFDAILVVGDIAARGREAEYANATHFLRSATEIVGCSSDQVICVPGNHDVGRQMQVPAHGHIRRGLRTLPVETVSDALVQLVRDDLSGAVMFHPFAAYNKFALGYDCDIGRDRPMWPPKTFDLSGRVLEVHGLTSCWVADAADSTAPESQLVCGIFQAVPVGSDPDRVHLTLCHHPPRWLRDAELLRPWIAQASLVLTGHEHDAGLTLSEDQRTLYLASGAVNPERTQNGWIPAYNVIELDINGEQESQLSASVYVRTWQGGTGHAEFGRSADHDDPVVRGCPASR